MTLEKRKLGHLPAETQGDRSKERVISCFNRKCKDDEHVHTYGLKK